jgi:hypothetical protein
MLQIAILLPVVVLTFSSCSTGPTSEDARLTATQTGEPGGVRVETITDTATVKSIDKATRKITLTTKDGSETTITAGPEVANFDQIEVGDHVKTTVTVKLAVSLRKPGEPSDDSLTASVERTPSGAKPGLALASTMEVTAKITAIDVKHQEVTLLFPNGTSKTFKVRKDVDLTKRSVGEEVVICATEAMTISVEKP